MTSIGGGGSVFLEVDVVLMITGGVRMVMSLDKS